MTSKVAAGASIFSTHTEGAMDMTQRRSNSYEQLEQALDEFPPMEQVTTHMVLNNEVTAGDSLVMTAGELQRELADLIQGAEAFKVLISVAYDEIENVAFVALNGPAQYVGDLAAFMAAPRSANAR